MTALSALLAAYNAAEPKRAPGGIRAISGFDYQLRAYLADFVAALASEAGLAPAGVEFANALEALSDYTAHQDSNTVFVQAKRNLTSTTAASAAGEFALIDRFLEKHGPLSELSSCRFQVIASRSEWNGSWSTITLPAAITRTDATLQDRFDLLVRDGRVLTPRIEADPWWHLIATAYPHLDDVFRFARRALDHCLSRGEDRSANAVRLAIIEDFEASRRKTRLTGRLLEQNRVAPLEGAPASFVLSETPTLQHLRAGCFMDRPEILQDLMRTLEGVLAGPRLSAGNGLDVLWLDGRSGSGKSVLLLQLVQQLVRAHGVPVLWLGGASSELAELLSRWGERRGKLSEFVLVAIDDMYDPQGRDELDLPNLLPRILHAESVAWPVVLTTGPSEFREKFEQDTRGEGFRVHPWQLPPLTQGHTRQLQEWYYHRTGELPKSGPAASQEQGLMLSVMAEMRHGNLRPLAYRFRARLSECGLADRLRVPLALNRLYIWSPREWLTAEDEERLEQLLESGDFSLVTVEARREYFKLTHPHLSNAIYEALHGGRHPKAYARDVAHAFEWALSRDLPLAMRVLGVVVSDYDRVRDLDPGTLLQGMAAAWTSARPFVDLFSHADSAQMWTSWARWYSRHPELAEFLGADPLDRAIDFLDAGDPNWAWLWLKLWACAPGHPELIAQGRHWLRTGTPHTWSVIWKQLLINQLEAGDNVRELIEAGYDWLSENEAVEGWSLVWQELLLCRPHLPAAVSYRELLCLGRTWLQDQQSRDGWSYVWRTLFHADAGELAQAGLNDLESLAVSWLAAEGGNAGWPFVWSDLVRSYTSTTSKALLRRMGEEWLEGRAAGAGIPFVTLGIVHQLAPQAPQQARVLFSNVLEWLKSQPDDRGWWAVFKATAGFGTRVIGRMERQRLLQLGDAWVRSRQASPDWTHAVVKVLEMAETNASPEQQEAVFQTGLAWLTNGENRSEYGMVWRRIFDIAVRTARTDHVESLTRSGLDFLDDIGRGADARWDVVWWGLLRMHSPLRGNVAPSDHVLRLRNVGLRWLTTPGRFSQGIWHQIYRGLLDRGEGGRTFLDLGTRRILYSDHPESSRLAQRLLEAYAPHEAPHELIAWMAAWFRTRKHATNRFSRLHAVARIVERAIAAGEGERWSVLTNALADSGLDRSLQNWARLVELHRTGATIPGRVLHQVMKKQRRGFLVDIGVNAYMSFHEAAIGSVEPQALIGREFTFVITRLDATRGHVDVSRRAALEPEAARFIGTIEPGQRVTGIIKARVEYGLFVTIGPIDALLHHSAICKHADGDTLAVGRELALEVRTVNEVNRRVSVVLRCQDCDADPNSV